MHISTFIFINGNRHLRGGVDDSFAPRRNILNVRNVALEEAFILGVDLDAVGITYSKVMPIVSLYDPLSPALSSLYAGCFYG